jgi:phosphopantothenate---cysteine ligase (CTP)
VNILVSGGGTIAPIDDVRRITNLSTGRFAASISEEWLRKGAKVWHVHAPGAELPLQRHARLDGGLSRFDREELHAQLDEAIDGWNRHRERLTLEAIGSGTVDEYAATVERLLMNQPIDALFLAMAVSDYEPDPFQGKLGSDSETLVIQCRRTRKVIRSIRDWAPKAYLVGFKLLSGVSAAELIAAAEASNRANRADLTVANDLEHYRAGRHTIHLVRPGEMVETYEAEPAANLVRRVAEWIVLKPA